MKQLLNADLRPVIRLSEVEKLIKRHRILTPPPSRKTLQRMCEDGTFDAVGNAPTTLGWLIYEDSFLRWVNSLDGSKIKNAA
jgi:hypothetical protein